MVTGCRGVNNKQGSEGQDEISSSMSQSQLRAINEKRILRQPEVVQYERHDAKEHLQAKRSQSG